MAKLSQDHISQSLLILLMYYFIVSFYSVYMIFSYK